MTTLKKRAFALCFIVLTVLSISLPVFASDDNIGYSFDLDAGYLNSYSTGRYRQTTNLENQWKVKMTYHSRSTTGKATYWLARSGDKERVSNTVDVKCGTSAKYRDAWSGASQATVCLGCENYLNQTAEVSGYWDEETN